MAQENKIQPSKEVDEYIAAFPKAVQSALMKLRQWIQKLAPEAQEQICYKIACYKHQGMLVGFGATENHCSFYACHTTILDSFKAELKEFKYSGVTIHFAPEKSIPFSLIKNWCSSELSRTKI
jgi:uncharacterized protein YdhG (YjbR/CyaY superfamily)